MTTDLRTITNGAILATFKEITQNGVTYLVVPGVPIREQVLNNYLVPGDEIAHFVGAWNGIPVTVGHPKQNNGTANVPNPDVPVIGTLFNCAWDGEENKLTAEYWIDEAKASETIAGQGIVANIRAGKALETSTGYWADEETTSGVFANRAYDLIHRNLRPDHVAILIGEEGACSLKDGCGVNRNCSGCTKMKTEPVDSSVSTCPCGNGQDSALSNEAQQPAHQNQTKEKAMPKQNELVKLFSALGAALGIKINAEIQTENAEEEQPTSAPATTSAQSVAPVETPATPAPALNAQAEDVAVFTNQEATYLRGYVSLMADFGGPDGLRTLLQAMQEAQTMVQNAKQADETKRNELIGQLKLNARCPFGEAELSVMPLETLTKLNATLAPINYSGLGLKVEANANAGDKESSGPAPVLLNASNFKSQADKKEK
jgi:hypothetical protein